jgi:hypothetical protein
LEEYDILRSVDRGLDAFGSHLKQTIYWKISILHGSMNKAVIAKPTIFVELLRQLLRDSATGVERCIIQELRRDFELSPEEAQDLHTALEAAKSQITPTASIS